MATDGLILGTMLRNHLRNEHNDDDGIAAYLEEGLHQRIKSALKRAGKGSYSECNQKAVCKLIFGVEAHCKKYGVICNDVGKCDHDDPTPDNQPLQCFKPTCVRHFGPEKLAHLIAACEVENIFWDIPDPGSASAKSNTREVALSMVLRESVGDSRVDNKTASVCTSISYEPVPSDEKTMEQVMEDVTSKHIASLRGEVDGCNASFERRLHAYTAELRSYTAELVDEAVTRRVTQEMKDFFVGGGLKRADRETEHCILKEEDKCMEHAERSFFEMWFCCNDSSFKFGHDRSDTSPVVLSRSVLAGILQQCCDDVRPSAPLSWARDQITNELTRITEEPYLQSHFCAVAAGREDDPKLWRLAELTRLVGHESRYASDFRETFHCAQGFYKYGPKFWSFVIRRNGEYEGEVVASMVTKISSYAPVPLVCQRKGKDKVFSYSPTLDLPMGESQYHQHKGASQTYMEPLEATMMHTCRESIDLVMKDPKAERGMLGFMLFKYLADNRAAKVNELFFSPSSEAAWSTADGVLGRMTKRGNDDMAQSAAAAAASEQEAPVFEVEDNVAMEQYFSRVATREECLAFAKQRCPNLDEMSRRYRLVVVPEKHFWPRYVQYKQRLQYELDYQQAPTGPPGKRSKKK